MIRCRYCNEGHMSMNCPQRPDVGGSPPPPGSDELDADEEEEIQQMTQQVYQSEMVVRELQRGDLVEQGLVSPPVPICEGLKVGATVKVGSVDCVMQTLGLHWNTSMMRYCDRTGKLVRFLGEEQVNAFVEFVNTPSIEGVDRACYTIPSCCLSVSD